MNNVEVLKDKFLLKEKELSKYATKSIDAIRLKEEDNDIRPPFFRDTDRIMHVFSYTRYLNKTQVYSFLENDYISKRMLHVQFVSKIARTIGRAIGLNEDLIEAIALGHDIGHTPLGHVGESILNEISLKYLNELFAHNLQSVRTYLTLEKNGRGVNLTLQVLDGIMCHNGEMLSNIYEPVNKTKEEFLDEYNKAYKSKDVLKGLCPMTLEGCVVRLSDVIAYIGRDIEDAIYIGKLNRRDIPESITNVLGNNNKSIINIIILDIVNNSLDKPYIKLSQKVYNALQELLLFNYKYIYNFANSKEDIDKYRSSFYKLYELYMNDLNNSNINSCIYKVFLNDMSNEYMENTSKERKVIDFIAGMTDNFFVNQIENI